MKFDDFSCLETLGARSTCRRTPYDWITIIYLLSEVFKWGVQATFRRVGCSFGKSEGVQKWYRVPSGLRNATGLKICDQRGFIYTFYGKKSVLKNFKIFMIFSIDLVGGVDQNPQLPYMISAIISPKSCVWKWFRVPRGLRAPWQFKTCAIVSLDMVDMIWNKPIKKILSELRDRGHQSWTSCQISQHIPYVDCNGTSTENLSARRLFNFDDLYLWAQTIFFWSVCFKSHLLCLN